MISYFLPDDASFFTNITNRLEDAKPIATVRKAFPSYFPAEPVSLPGTTQAVRRGSEGASSSREGGSDKKKGKAGMKEKDDAPGSKAGLAKVLSSGHLFLAARVGDINAVADALKVKVEDHCWPVLFSSKPGKAALALCPCPDRHDGIDSKWHKPPKGFNQAQFIKKYWSAASAEQLKEAGWRNSKKAKT